MKILTDAHICEILNAGNSVVSISVSGGKDSDSLALELNDYLDSINFKGERVLIHSDLGEIEHSDSLPTCRRLSKHTGIPLIVVKPKRPMIERWAYRWECNVERFINLKTVKIATWASSAVWRYCTSEEKTAPICRKLKELYPGKYILNAVGIRAEESASRAKKPIWTKNDLLYSARLKTNGITWFPIRDYTLEDIFLSHRQRNFQKHEAYHKNGNTRVSCVFCVLAGETDLRASLRDQRTHDVYRRIVEIEAVSTFSFQPNRWLGDLAPEVLSKSLRETLQIAKDKAVLRRFAEKNIPPEMLFNAATGFPAFLPSLEQSERLAKARRTIGDVLGLQMNFVTASTVRARYAQLLEEKQRREQKKGKPRDSAPLSQPHLFALS